MMRIILPLLFTLVAAFATGCGGVDPDLEPEMEQAVTEDGLMIRGWGTQNDTCTVGSESGECTSKNTDGTCKVCRVGHRDYCRLGNLWVACIEAVVPLRASP